MKLFIIVIQYLYYNCDPITSRVCACPSQQGLPLVFTANVTGGRWIGEALLPWRYFPRNVNKMNSYAIHGSGQDRTYEALYPVPTEDLVEGQKPNL